MKQYFEKLAADYEKADEFLYLKEEGERGLAKVKGKLLPGLKCAWCYEDDIKFWKGEKIKRPYPSQWLYQGFIVPFPETDGRNEMEPHHVMVVITQYPIEKENPVTDWAVLARLLEPPDLHEFYVFQPIKLM